MNFLFLGIFSRFFWIQFAIFMLKLNKKCRKRFYFRAGSRGCDVARKATWQRHTGPRGAYAAKWHMRDIYIYYNIVYKYSLPLIGRELLTLRYDAPHKHDILS